MEVDYCQLEDVKSALGIEPADTKEDSALARVITAVSRQVDSYCWRRFYARAESRQYSAHFEDWLDVDDLLEITELAADLDGDREYECVWSVEDYYLLPDNAQANGKPYTAVATTLDGSHAFPIGIRSGVRITGTFGYSLEVPATVREAAILQSARIFKRKDAVFGVTGSAEMGQLMVIAKLDPDVKQLLDPLRRLI